MKRTLLYWLIILFPLALASCKGGKSSDVYYYENKVEELQQKIDVASARQELEILDATKQERIALETEALRTQREAQQQERERQALIHAVLRWVLPVWTFVRYAWLSVMLFAVPAGLVWYLKSKKPLVSHKVGNAEFSGYAGELDLNALSQGLVDAQQVLAGKETHADPSEVLNYTAQFMGLTGQFMAQSAKYLKAVNVPSVVSPIGDESKALPPVRSCSFVELQEHEDRETRSIPIGLEAETGNLCQARPNELTSLLIEGKPGTGKSHAAKSVILSLLGLYEDGLDLEMIVIDPHFNAPDGLTTWLKPALNHPAIVKKVLGTKAIKQGTVTACLKDLHAEAERRQDAGTSSPLKILVIDELRLLCNDKKHGADNYDLLVELLNDRKFGIFCLYLSQDYTAKALGGTGISGLGCSSLVLNSKESKARVLLEDDSKLAVNLPKGQAVFSLPGNESVVVNIPTVSARDLQPFQSLETSEGTGETGVTPDAVRNYIEEHETTQNDLAKSLEISKKDMSLWMNNKKLSDGKQESIERKLSRVLYPSESRKVVNLGNYRT